MKDLLLITLGGNQYGLWRDELQTVEPVRELHHFPASPSWIAGISIVDHSTTALADLSACLGYAPFDPGRQGSVLLLKKKEKINGFVLNGSVETIVVGEADLINLPSHLSTPVISSCIVRSGILVPVLDLSRLIPQLLKQKREAGLDGPSLLPALPASARGNRTGMRLVRIGCDVYAVPGGTESRCVPRGAVALLPFSPPTLQGVTLAEGVLTAVIDSGPVLHSGSSGDLLLLLEISGLPFGLLISEFLDHVPSSDMNLLELPLAARSRLLRSALVFGREIILVLDVEALVRPSGPEGLLETETSRHDAPDSQFNDLFLKSDLEVFEFSLFGGRYALPASEVEGEIALTPWRVVPGTQPVVAGVAEYEERLLPVLDLAAVFGMRSAPDPEWRMVVVRNGDFRGLVLCEAVAGKRPLPLTLQRSVPIALPHHLVYGCYPEAGAVRLILNVRSLVVHFEKARGRDMGVLAPPEAGQANVRAAQPVQKEPLHDIFMSREGGEIPAEEADEPLEEAVQERGEAEPAAVNAPLPASHEGEPVPREEEHVRDREEAERVSGEQEIVMPAQQEPVQALSPGVYAEELASAAEPVSSGVHEQPKEPEAVTSAKTTSVVSALSEPHHPSTETFEERQEPAPFAADSVRPVHQRPASRIVWYAAFALMMLAVFWVVFMKSEGPLPERPASPQATEERKSDHQASDAPLVLEVPANKPITAEIYTVTEGDTLWSISQRFTGSPYNYPRIAGENRIADADLIYPGQKIRLKKQAAR